MRLPWRRKPAAATAAAATAAASEAAPTAADARADRPEPPHPADRSCCCPASPVVRVQFPPTFAGRPSVDLLLCGHHYRSSKAALTAIGAVAVDETGAIINPAPAPRAPAAPLSTPGASAFPAP
jgi:hypothetical protein